MEHCSYRFGRQSDLQMLSSQMGEGSWRSLSRLLEYGCTKPEWILLGFKAGSLAAALALAAPSEFNLPLEIIRLHGGLDKRIDSFRLFRMAIDKARTLGVHQLYCTVPEESIDAAILSEALFRRWRNLVRFESAGPLGPVVRGYRSAEVGTFARAEIVALIEKASEHSSDSQIEFYRRRFGGIADAEWTLQMIESTRYDPRWWRVAIGPEGQRLGIILPTVAFGESTIGFIGVPPEYRGRNIASFLLAESWSVMKLQGHSTLCAEADERSVSMHRALSKSQFSPRWTRQEWRLEL